jgi:hypothetical protein
MKLALVLMFFVFPRLLLAGPIEELQPGHWYEVPNSNLRDVAASPSPGGGVHKVMQAWSGAAYDTNRERLIVWGGGHSDYAGNEIYVFDTGTLRWQRLNEPSSNVSGTNEPFYPDGLPRSRHTYNYIEYLPNIDRFVSFGGSGPYPVGGGTFTRIVSEFNFDSLTWSHDRAQVPRASGTGTGNLISSIATYDSVTGNVWQHSMGASGNQLSQYNPVTDTWTVHASKYVRIYSTPAIDTNRHQLVIVGNDQILAWDLNAPDAAPITPVTSGDNTMEAAIAPGFQYDPVSDKLVAWDGGADVYLLDPATWVWTKISPATTNTVVPTSKEPNGTYGRFRYIPSKNVFIAVNRTSENVYLFRLTSGTGASIPMLNLSASPTSITAGDSSTLSWSSTNTTSCTATDAWSGTKATSGMQRVSPASTSTYTLTCTGAGGSASRSVTVTVTTNAAPTVSLSASPASITSGSSSTLTWSSANATSCTASGSSAFTGTKATSGSQGVSPASTTTYTLSCTGSSGSASNSATVTVTAASGGGATSSTGGGGSLGWLSLLGLVLARLVSSRSLPHRRLAGMLNGDSRLSRNSSVQQS